MGHPQPNPTPGPAPQATPNSTPSSSPKTGPAVTSTPSPIGPPPDHSMPSGTISYPIQRLLHTAQQIRQNAHSGLDKLALEESKLTSYARSFPDVMYPSVAALFGKYKKHVEENCNMQLVFAKWLEQAGAEMQSADGQIKTSFQQFARDHSAY